MNGWISQGYIGDSSDQYWVNTDTGATYQGYAPPAPVPVSTAWDNLAAYAPVVSFGSPEDQTAAVSWAASTAVDVPGYGSLYFAYADGIHPSGAARINSDDSEDVYYPNADGSIGTRHYTAEQVRTASQNTDWTNSYLGPLLAIALPALPSLLAYYGVIGSATAAPVLESASVVLPSAGVDSTALVAELAAQDAAAVALENTIAETLAQAEVLSTAASTAAEANIAQPAVQQAAQVAQAASKTLETAATTAATAATPATAASVLANLKTVAAVATTAAATLRAVTNATNPATTSYVPGQINPATGLPYLTQSQYGSTNSTMLLLAAGLAAVLLVGGKR